MFRSLPVFKKIKTSRYQYQIKIIPLLPYSMRTADFRKWRERIWNTNISIGKIEDCINHIIGWYSNNFLLCNSAKTKAIYFSSKFINNDPISSMNIGASTIKLKPAVCDVGVVLDRHVLPWILVLVPSNWNLPYAMLVWFWIDMSTCQDKSIISVNWRL